MLDLPLGDPRARAPWTVMANVLGGDYPDMYPAYLHCMARDPGAEDPHVRQGREARPQGRPRHRLGDDLGRACASAPAHAADYLRGMITE